MDANNRDEYLISVLFDVDKDGESKFKAATQMAGKGVASVGRAAAGMAVSLGEAVLKASSELSKFSLQATRAGTSESKIRALGYAFEQVGGDAGQAMQSVANLRTKLRDMPAVAQGMKRILNVDAFDKATGKLRDHVDILRDMGKAFQKMSAAQATLAGAQFGLDADTVDLLRSGKMEKFYAQALDDQKRMGINLDENAKKAQQLMMSVNRGIEYIKVYAMASITDLAGAWAESFVDRLPDIFGAWLDFQRKALKSLANDGVWSTIKDWYNDEGAFKPKTQGVLDTLTPEQKKMTGSAPTLENADGKAQPPIRLTFTDKTQPKAEPFVFGDVFKEKGENDAPTAWDKVLSGNGSPKGKEALSKPENAPQGDIELKAPDIPAVKVENAEIEAPKFDAVRVDVPTIPKVSVDSVEVSAPKLDPLDVKTPTLPRLSVDTPEPIGVDAPRSIGVDVPAIEAPKLGNVGVDAPAFPTVSVSAPDSVPMSVPTLPTLKTETPTVKAPKLDPLTVETPKVDPVEVLGVFDVRSAYAVPKRERDRQKESVLPTKSVADAPKDRGREAVESVGLGSPAVITTPSGETSVSNVTNNQTTNNSTAQSSNVTVNQNITVNGGQDLARATGDAVRVATNDGLRSFGSAIR